MSKKYAALLLVVGGIVFILSNTCYATQLLNKEEAFHKVFGEGVHVSRETKELTPEKIKKIKERLGGILHYINQDAKVQVIPDDVRIDFDFAIKDGQKIGVAIIDIEPGKWGPVELIVAMDLNGIVTRVEILNYQERRGQPVARHSFLAQFEGKNGKNIPEIGKDITVVSGATVSSSCVNFAVKKAIVIYEELYLKK